MENDIRPREGLLEPVLPGSAIFDDSILPPLHNSYLYEESRKSFIYTSAHLINNDILQKEYAAFRVEKRESGYSEEELEESFGFLLFEDESKANELGDSGLLTGHSSCSTLGDPSKGVYVSKYSDCLDVKRWYCGKSGYIAIVRLTKGRVKDVSENYTVNFTAPSEGFDCHESDQLGSVTATTSSFLAFERTQHYLYELDEVCGEARRKCPRHVCPFAVVAFSYGKAEPAAPESPEKSKEKTVFYYQLWTGQLVIDSLVYEIGLKSSNGALLPAKLPKTLGIQSVIRVSELKMLLPKEVFETCFSGEVMVGGKCCTLYEVISTKAEDDSVSFLTEELKEKDLALVFRLDDSGFFVLLHSSYFLSYEDASSEKTEALQGMFIFPDSRTIQRDTKSCRKKSKKSSEILQVLPALNYAETEVEKSGPSQHEKIGILLEKHLEHYGTLIHPGLQSSPQREASMFPDQYDVPYVFNHLFPAPKWTEITKLQMKSYLDQPCSFEIPLKRATELLLTGREQSRDDPDDEVYYYISSPEEALRTPTSEWPEKPLEAVVSSGTFDGIDSTARKLPDNHEPPVSPTRSVQPDLSDLSKQKTEILSKESSPALETLPSTLEVDLTTTPTPTEISEPATAVVTQEPVSSLTSTQLPTECVSVNSCGDQTLQNSSAAQEASTNENTLQISSETSVPMEASNTKFAETEAKIALCPESENKAPTLSLPRRRGRKRKRMPETSVSKKSSKQSLHSSHLSPSEATEGHCMGPKQNQPEKDQSNLQKCNNEDLNKAFVDQVELISNSSPPSECLDNSYSQSQETVENQLSEPGASSKTNWGSLPRRGRKDQNSPTDVPEGGNEELLKKDGIDSEQTHPLKRKMERESLRYDLKTIITDCGRIFVPHGTEVLSKDLELVMNRQKTADGVSGFKKKKVEEAVLPTLSSDTTGSVGITETVNDALDKQDSLSLTKQIGETTEQADRPVLRQSEQTPPNVHEDHNTKNESSSETKLAVDGVQSAEPGEIKEPCSTESVQKKKRRGTEYTIISISQLRTVLRRGKKVCGSAMEKAKEVGSTESKIPQDGVKTNTDDCKSNSDIVWQGNPDQASSDTLTPENSGCFSPSQKHQSFVQESTDKNHLEPGMKPCKDVNKLDTSDQNVPLLKNASSKRNKRAKPPRKYHKRKAKDLFKENERLSSDTPVSHNTEHLKQTEAQTSNDIFTGQVLGEPCIGSDKKNSSLEGVGSAASQPADALTLLADLALSGNSGKKDKTLQSLGVGVESKLSHRQGVPGSVKQGGSQDAVSVLHALLRGPKDMLQLPAKSPLPRGLVVKGECVVVISKDHSYSQPPSLVLGLSGATLQAIPFSRCTDPLTVPNPLGLQGKPLIGRDDRILLQVQREPSSDSWDKQCVNRKGWENWSPLKNPAIYKEMRRIKRRRQIVEKGGSIKVTRLWSEQYDFSLDSKFTNDPHDKTVTRALHGPWNYNIRDSPGEIHLIFNMWIGLFYSKSASRFFHIDPNCLILQDGKLPEEVELHSTSRFLKSNETKVYSQINTSLKMVPSPLPATPGVLSLRDETNNASTSSSEALDLSVKGCEPLDLTSTDTKTREFCREKHDPQSLESLSGPENTNTKCPLSEMKSPFVSVHTDSQFRQVHDVAGNSGNVVREMNDVCLRGINTKSSNLYESDRNIKSSSNCPPENRDSVNVQQTANVSSDIQNCSDTQRESCSLPGTKELAGNSSASVVQLNSTDELAHKEDIFSSQLDCSAAEKLASPKHIESTYTPEESPTLLLDKMNSVFTDHDGVVKPPGHVALKSNTDSSGEATMSAPSDGNSSDETAEAVNDQRDSKAETVGTGQDQNSFESETVMVDRNNSEVETTMSVDVNNSKEDTITLGQNLSGSKSETTTIVQGAHGLEASVMFDVQGPIGAEVEMAQKHNDHSAKDIMAVHDLNKLNSKTMATEDDPIDCKVKTVTVAHDQKDSKVETTTTEQNQDDSETKTTLALQEHDSEADKAIMERIQNEPKGETALQASNDGKVEPVITEENQNKTRPETAVAVKFLNDNEVQPCLTMQHQPETQSETAVASQAQKDFELQPVITEQNQTKSETAVALHAHNDSEMKAIVSMNQNDLKPTTPVVEQEQNNTQGETQVLEPVSLNTEILPSEDINTYSKDDEIMELDETNEQLDKVPVYSVNENEVLEVQRDCHSECEMSTADNDNQADAVIKAVEETDHQNVEHEVAAVKEWDDEGGHEGKVVEDLVLGREQNEQTSQSRSIMVGETKDESSAHTAEMPFDVKEGQKISEIIQGTVLTSCQEAHDLSYMTKEHELKGSDSDNRCPTPTIDELPYKSRVYGDQNNPMGRGSAFSQGSTPTQDELRSDCESAICEGSSHKAYSDYYDKAVYNTEGQNLVALSNMITWFRNEQKNRQGLKSLSSQNSVPVQLRLSTSYDSISSQSNEKSHWKSPNSASHCSSNKGFSSSSADYMESNVQSTEEYRVQCEDVAMTYREFWSNDKLSPFQSTHSVDKHQNVMDPCARDSELTGNLSFSSLSKSTLHESFHSVGEANTAKNRKEKHVKTYQQEKILDTESVSMIRMKDELQEWNYSEDIYSSKQKHSSRCHFQQRNPADIDISGHWEKEEVDDTLHYGMTSLFVKNYQMGESGQSSHTVSSSESGQKVYCNESFMKYNQREGLRVTVDFKRGDSNLSDHKFPTFTVLDNKDKQKTYWNYPITKPRITMHSRTIQNTYHKGTHKFVKKFFQKWDALHQTEDDATQSSMDFEYVVFSEKMNHILKSSKPKTRQRSNLACQSPMTIQFSSLNEQDTSEEMSNALPMFSESKIKVTLPNRKDERAEDSGHMPLRLQRLSCKRESEAACANISAITAECAESYYAMMNDICTNKNTPRKTDRIRKQLDSPKVKSKPSDSSKPDELCGKMREDMFERLHDGLNSVVREACKTKYRFFILVTSEDPFFEETKDRLENEGHICVEPDQFDLESSRPSSPLIIILRNEDISEHICQVPHLLDLKKSSSVLFAGIDQPDDVVNLTHQELFGKGGFVVFHRTAMNKLTLDNMKKIVTCLEELSKKGKWKWFLHYRDGRWFRENARSHQDVQDKKHFLDCCQEAGIVEVLPYHECDVISCDLPNYLHCLIRLQVQNATTRFPVFVTDTPDKSFGKNGILTMNMNTFSQMLSNDSCTIS